jgi:hypothetical protein
MTFNYKYTREAIAVTWLLVVCAVGVVIHAASLAAWTTLAALALLPLVVMWRLWTPPLQTMSESIQKARRPEGVD